MRNLLCSAIILLFFASCASDKDTSYQSRITGRWIESSSILSEKAIDQGWKEEHMKWEITLHPDGTFSDRYILKTIDFSEQGNGTYFIEDDLLTTIYTHGIRQDTVYDGYDAQYYYRIAALNDSTMVLFSLGDNDTGEEGTNNIQSVEEAKLISIDDYMYYSTLHKCVD